MARKGSFLWGQEIGVDDAQRVVPNPLFPSASSEDIVIEEFAQQEPNGEDSQEALAAEGDEGS